MLCVLTHLYHSQHELFRNITSMGCHQASHFPLSTHTSEPWASITSTLYSTCLVGINHCLLGTPHRLLLWKTTEINIKCNVKQFCQKDGGVYKYIYGMYTCHTCIVRIVCCHAVSQQVQVLVI